MRQAPVTASLVWQTFTLGRQVKRAFGQAMADEAWAIEADLRPGCYGVLRCVASGPVSQREIADDMSLDASVVVDLIDRLEAAGLVERRRDPVDRRRYALTITEHGQTAVQRFAAVSQRVSDELLSRLDTAERVELSRLLDLVLADDAASGSPANRSPDQVPERRFG